MSEQNPIKALLIIDCSTGEGGRLDEQVLVEFSNLPVLRLHRYTDFIALLPKLKQIISQRGQDTMKEIPIKYRDRKMGFLQSNYEYEINWVSAIYRHNLTKKQLDQPVAMKVHQTNVTVKDKDRKLITFDCDQFITGDPESDSEDELDTLRRWEPLL